MLRRTVHFAILAVAGAALLATPAGAVTVPWPFVADAVGPYQGFERPTSFAFVPDGRILVGEQSGLLHVIENGQLVTTPMWDGRTEVLDDSDRGLLAVAVDPDFANNHFVYLLYTVDPDSNDVEDNYEAFGRLTRYATRVDAPNELDPDTRTVLIGATWSDGVPDGFISHTVGGLRWGEDGSLLVSAGEGGHYIGVDQGGRYPDLFLPGRTDPAEDVGAFRAQRIQSLAGKILRIDPHTGLGYASNPFAEADLSTARSRVWAYGLRNPFRFCVMPGTGNPDPGQGEPGVLSVGDVGWETWEELNAVTHGGQNFGWPCREGPEPNGPYLAAAPATNGCETIGTPDNPSPADPPTIVWHHSDDALSTPSGFHGLCVIGGVFYSGAGYPYHYRGRLFFGDFSQSWVNTALIGPGGELQDFEEFAQDAEGPVDFNVDPATGDVMMLTFFTGTLYRIHWTGPLAAPTPAPRLELSMPFPNPSDRAVSLSLEVPERSQVGFDVVDVTGRSIRAEAPREFPAGRWMLTWDGRDGAGTRARPGVYWLRVAAGERRYVRRAVLVR